MSSVLRHIFDSLLLDTGSEYRCPILRSNIWRIEHELDVQRFRELDGN